jgi:uncharacterized protein (DUF427 family)
MADHVRVSPAARIRVVLAGEAIVDTKRGFVVHEGGMPARYYVPREEVRAELHATSDAGACPWKGKWRHFDVFAGGVRVPRAAWVYEETTKVAAPIQGFVCFYPNKVEALEATELELEARPEIRAEAKLEAPAPATSSAAADPANDAEAR